MPYLIPIASFIRTLSWLLFIAPSRAGPDNNRGACSIRAAPKSAHAPASPDNCRDEALLEHAEAHVWACELCVMYRDFIHQTQSRQSRVSDLF